MDWKKIGSFKTGGRKINNLSQTNDTILIAEYKNIFQVRIMKIK